MRHFLISALLLSLVAGCSSVNIGPHRIDVQQGNALDQENVKRLKPGLNRSQVRFLLGTPLVVDPFRTDRWDYVYVYYKAGKLAEQKHITLFFEGDTLTRIEGDLPPAEPVAPSPDPAAQPQPKAESAALPAVAEAKPTPVPTPTPELKPEPAAPVAPPPKVAAVATAPVATGAPPAPAPAAAPVAAPAAAPVVAPAVAPAQKSPAPRAMAPETSIVPPLPSPKNAPPYVDPRTPAELSLQPETDVAQIKPDAIPPFPESHPVATASDDPVLKSLNAWASAWARRDAESYFAAYAPGFVPQGGDGRADWEKRRRLLFDVAKNVEVKIDSPSVDRADDGSVTVTFNQFYRSDSYRDAVVKQLRMIERDGHWLIVEEKVLSILHGAKR